MNRFLQATLIVLMLSIGRGMNADNYLASPLRNGRSRSLALLEPESGCMTGVNLGWSTQTAVGFNAGVGWDHCVFVDFTEFPHAGGYGYLDSRMGQVKEVGGIYLATLEPTGGLDAVTQDACNEFAGWCAYWNGQGVSIFVRFAHEMNGDWYAWRMRPTLYREKFRMLADVVHATAPDTAMLWAPNEASSYPYGVFDGMSRVDYLAQYGSLEDWLLLDTNTDDILSNPGVLNDHPYEPFYPGDDVVDWVGMTIYHWGTAYPWLYNTYPEVWKFWEMITGNYNGPNGDCLWNPDFYAEYAEAKSKPMMIPETSAFFRPSLPVPPDPFWPPQQTQDEYEIKSLWIEQIFNVSGDNANAKDIADHLPLLKCVNWFNHYKMEAEADDDWVDWTVTSNSAVTDKYYNSLNVMKSGRRYFLRADDLVGYVYGWNCSLMGWVSGGSPFSASIDTDAPYEGRGCVRIDFDNSAPSGDKNAMADLSAMADDITWADHDVIYLRAKTPKSAKSASFQLIMQSEGDGWDVLGTVPCANDGDWHTLAFHYEWDKHAASAWLNLYLRVMLPDKGAASVYVDAFQTGNSSELPCYSLGSVFDLAFEDAQFTARPKVKAIYSDPLKDQRNRSAPVSVITKVNRRNPTDTVKCEWKHAIPLFSKKSINAARWDGVSTQTWLATPANQSSLDVSLWISSANLTPTRQELFQGWLKPPLIVSAVPSGDGMMALSGQWFGIKGLTVGREYVDAKGRIKLQRMKVLKPDDPAYVDAKGRMSYMDAATGASYVQLKIPSAPPKGLLNGVVVLQNRIGIAAFTED